MHRQNFPQDRGRAHQNRNFRPDYSNPAEGRQDRGQHFGGEGRRMMEDRGSRDTSFERGNDYSRQDAEWRREGGNDQFSGQYMGGGERASQRGDFGNRMTDDRREGQPYMSDRGYGREGFDRMSEGGHYGNERSQRDFADWNQRSMGQSYGQGGYGQRDYGQVHHGGYGPGYQGGYDDGSFSYSERSGGYGDRSGQLQGGYSGQDRGNFGMNENTRQNVGRGPKGYKRSDERIREDVCDRLASQGNLDASEVEVQVSEGEVTLTGTVLCRNDKRFIEQVAESVPGVLEVHNQIRMQRGTASREHEIDSEKGEKSPPATKSSASTGEEERSPKTTKRN